MLTMKNKLIKVLFSLWCNRGEKVDKEKGLLFVKGSCPGPKNSLVVITKKKVS